MFKLLIDGEISVKVHKKSIDEAEVMGKGYAPNPY